MFQYSNSWTTPATLLTPVDNSTVSQVDFSWTNVPGAVQYHLQASVTSDFTAMVVDVTVYSTKYSPPTTLNNSTYYWRVEPVNSKGAKGTMSATFEFTRAWPASDIPTATNHVTLLTPTDGNFAVTQPDFSWTPETLASQYEMWMGDDSNFSPGSYSSCKTNHTSLTPYSGCNPSPGVHYYWRVRAIDGPANILGIWSDTWSFIYRPNPVSPLLPADNATVTVPNLVWSQTDPDIAKFRITIYDSTDSQVNQATTYNTSYVPQGLDPTKGPFHWHVQTIDGSGRLGPEPFPGNDFHFSLTDPTFYSAPDASPASAGSSARVPLLQWHAMDAVDSHDPSYKIWYAPQGSNIYTSLASGLKTAAYAHLNDNVNPGNYHWYVEANINGDITDGTEGTFTVSPLPNTVLVLPANCAAAPQPCPTVADTPTLQWQSVPGAEKYLVSLARDPDFTNVYKTYTTTYHTLLPEESLADSQAGQATYWYARPCYGSVCGPEPASFSGQPDSPVFSFRKQSEPIVGLTVTPTPGAPNNTVNTNQITFSWTDYLASNLIADRPNTQEARQYVLQVSDTQDFSHILQTSPGLDQTTFTSYGSTYPDGPLYWRVQAIDGSGNALPYGTYGVAHDGDLPVAINKVSPVPTGLSPNSGATVPAVPTLSWSALDFSSHYVIEVYKNVDQPLSSSNRVVNVTLATTAYTPTSTLAGRHLRLAAAPARRAGPRRTVDRRLGGRPAEVHHRPGTTHPGEPRRRLRGRRLHPAVHVERGHHRGQVPHRRGRQPGLHREHLADHRHDGLGADDQLHRRRLLLEGHLHRPGQQRPGHLGHPQLHRRRGGRRLPPAWHPPASSTAAPASAAGTGS